MKVLCVCLFLLLTSVRAGPVSCLHFSMWTSMFRNSDYFGSFTSLSLICSCVSGSMCGIMFSSRYDVKYFRTSQFSNVEIVKVGQVIYGSNVEEKAIIMKTTKYIENFNMVKFEFGNGNEFTVTDDYGMIIRKDMQTDEYFGIGNECTNKWFNI